MDQKHLSGGGGNSPCGKSGVRVPYRWVPVIDYQYLSEYEAYGSDEIRERNGPGHHLSESEALLCQGFRPVSLYGRPGDETAVACR